MTPRVHHPDAGDPDPWRALWLDRSIPLDPHARDDLIATMRSRSRQLVLPLVRPLARSAIVLVQVFRLLVPRGLASTRLLHWTIARGLAAFVRPDANRLVLRHFHLGSDILRFIADNSGVDVPTRPLRPRCLDDLRQGIFVKHDVNLYAFVIRLNEALAGAGRRLETRPLEALDFSAIHEDPPELDPMPERRTNRLDLASAVELYTPLYQLLLSDSDFWRASNSLQLDETIALYVAALLGDSSRLGLVNNRHPLIPESTLRAGHRLLLHGLATETLHALLVALKRAQAQESPDVAAPGSARERRAGLATGSAAT